VSELQLDNMDSEECSTSRLIRSIMNIKKMLQSKRRRKKDRYDPNKVILTKSMIVTPFKSNYIIFQPCHILDLTVEPSMFLIVFDYLDVRSISRLESCCWQLQDMVVETRIYKRKWRGASERAGDGLLDRRSLEDVGKDELSQMESSRHFKKKLSEYYIRNPDILNFWSERSEYAALQQSQRSGHY
jgi:hypothetical protein